MAFEGLVNRGFERYVAIYKALGNEQRLKMMYLLCTLDNHVAVSEFAEVFNDSQSNASRQLKTLRDAGLLQKYRQGRSTFYSIPDDLDEFAAKALESIRSLPHGEISCEAQRCAELCVQREK